MDNNIFQNGFDSENAYVFGWIMSDGCLKKEGRNKTSYAVRICSNDLDIIQWMHSYMCVGNKIYRQGTNGFQIKFRNKDSIEFMRSYGLHERKSLDMELLDIPDEYFGDFLRGYFDGDGSIALKKTKYNTYGQASFTCGSLSFIDTLKERLGEFGIESHIYKDGRPTNNSYYLRVVKRSEIEKLYALMYERHDGAIRLMRKYNKFSLYMDCKPKYNIVKTA